MIKQEHNLEINDDGELENKISDFKIYPNPFNHSTTIVSNESGTMYVTDNIGQLVLKVPFTGVYEISKQDLKGSGLYFVLLQVNEKIIKHKLIVED